MPIDKEYATLEILNEYKWSKHFYCRNCSHTEYKKGKKPFSRRCKKCDYDESLLKFTAFEELKIPMYKAYAIISHLVDNTYVDFDKKGVLVKQNNDGKIFHVQNSDPPDVGEYISLNELYKKQYDGDVSYETFNVLFEKYISESRLIISDVARKFEVEENTVSKLFSRIAKRINDSSYDDYVWEPLETIKEFFGNGRYDLDYVLGMLMFPIDDTWHKNEKKVKGKWYHISPPSRFGNEVRWKIVLMTYYRKDANGNYRSYYSKESEQEYLAED
jgi:hypothetical protein